MIGDDYCMILHQIKRNKQRYPICVHTQCGTEKHTHQTVVEWTMSLKENKQRMLLKADNFIID